MSMELPVIPLKEWYRRLAENGYKLTQPRRAVVEIIAASDRILAPADVYELARRSCPGLGLVTVYRTVEKLEELGLVQRVHQPHDCHAFVAARPGHQHLLVCQGCGKVEFFSGDRMDTLIASVGDRSGFQVSSHWLQFFGLCEECRG